MIADLLGGIGLFLLGMMLTTEGMEEAAGEGLHALLKRATGNRVRGTVFGATLTLVFQSSTASTLATIGFVSAGLLTFYESLAVIVGTNVGTTSTGWLVSLIDFRISVSSFALPLVGIGALLRMLVDGWRLSASSVPGLGCADLSVRVAGDVRTGLHFWVTTDSQEARRERLRCATPCAVPYHLRRLDSGGEPGGSGADSAHVEPRGSLCQRGGMARCRR